jgi:hypothetical protein
MLMGIAAKNSILLVDYIIIAEDEGRPRLEAIMDAAHKRARPILMTTFAMGAGMLPIALGPRSSSASLWPLPWSRESASLTLSGLVIPTKRLRPTRKNRPGQTPAGHLIRAVC